MTASQEQSGGLECWRWSCRTGQPGLVADRPLCHSVNREGRLASGKGKKGVKREREILILFEYPLCGLKWGMGRDNGVAKNKAELVE